MILWGGHDMSKRRRFGGIWRARAMARQTRLHPDATKDGRAERHHQNFAPHLRRTKRLVQAWRKCNLWPRRPNHPHAGRDCICRSKLINPSSDRFIGNFNTALDQKLLDIPKAQIESKIQPNGAADNVWVEAVTLSGTPKNCSPFTVKSTIYSTIHVISSQEAFSESSGLKPIWNGNWRRHQFALESALREKWRLVQLTWQSHLT